MKILETRLLDFDRDDVKMMQAMLKQFNDLHQGTGMPDFSENYGGYLPVLTLALLSSQKSIDKLTQKMLLLTLLIAFFTIVLSALTVFLIIT